ncbi:uncharacterized protein NECHADRAFT_82061 [Fusarium vanettenii 77-13-4]|uniref:SNF2 N-terminal domain-containing protein n=1 Tax=Fusarium vanettenii (strain ATCC MYA-4622 / CBS 123669 / FGSC 9596 / NRRL 45880 / 77-13-4) TaxID=660122 RepID=C7ZAD5_FUSV7|nr:uncharacterized protein NECHADRAFT_82061 [Fusarium vanettenii 77-13-4]EEU39256.1 hypothetical protein NECHADRAFT_82061 [Fusarium vanettenii 77-13-4]
MNTRTSTATVAMGPRLRREHSKRKSLFSSFGNARLNWVTCDKGHAAKNPCSTTNKLVRALDREALLIVSAKPLLNHLRDFWGYVNLIWRHEWPFTHDGESEPISPETFYNDDAWDTIKTGEEFKKLGMARLLGQVPECLDLTRLHELALQLSPREEKLRQEYIAYVQGGRGPLFLLHLQPFQTLPRSSTGPFLLKPLSGHNIFQGATSQVLNGSGLRVLSLLTTNISFYLLTQPNRRNVKHRGDTEAMKILAEQKLAHFMPMDGNEDEVGEFKPADGGWAQQGCEGPYPLTT